MYRRRFKLNIEGPAGDATRKTYGFIYQGYGIFYWEVVIMLRKVSMVIVAVFGLRATVQTQALMALLVVLVAAAAHVHLKPFDVTILDKLELYGLLTAFTTLYFGMFFFTRDVEESPFFLALVTFIILSANFIFIIYWSHSLYGALVQEINTVNHFDVTVRVKYRHFCRKFCNCCCEINLSRTCRRCSAKLRWCGKKRRNRGRNEDSDSDDDMNSVEMVQHGDHTVWSRMSDGKNIRKDSLKSIHKNRASSHSRRISVKRGLEMEAVMNPKEFAIRRKKLREETKKSNVEAKIRESRASEVARKLGAEKKDSSSNSLPGPPTSSPPPTLPQGPPPSLPPAPAWNSNPMATSRWKKAMKKTKSNVRSKNQTKGSSRNNVKDPTTDEEALLMMKKAQLMKEEALLMMNKTQLMKEEALLMMNKTQEYFNGAESARDGEESQSSSSFDFPYLT